MNCLILIRCSWLLKNTLVITINLTNPKAASVSNANLTVSSKLDLNILLLIVNTFMQFLYTLMLFKNLKPIIMYMITLNIPKLL